jgi:hypothetical protein
VRRSREKATNHQALFFAFLCEMRPKQTKWVAILRAHEERDIPFKFAHRFDIDRGIFG